MTTTPEHDKREQAHGLHPDVNAAYEYVISVMSTADAGAGRWYGWALREAFLAGISYAEARIVRPKPTPPAWVTLAADNLARLRDGR